MREIPKKNYVILFILVLAVIFITLACATIYNNYSKKEVSYISEQVSIIDSTNIEDYLKENSIAIIYVSDINVTLNNQEEKKLLETIENLDLKKYLIFYDASESKNLTYLINNYNVEYNGTTKMLLVEDNQLVAELILEKQYSEEFLKFIEFYEVIDD